MPTETAPAPSPTASTPAPAAPNPAAASSPEAPAAPSTPASPATPAAAATPGDGTASPTITPGATPAAPAAGQGPAEPKQSDFPENAGAFLSAHDRWEQEKTQWDAEHPEDANVAAPGDAPKPDDAQTPADAPDTAAAAADPDEVQLGEGSEDEAATTPQAWQEVLDGDASLSAALEANPAAKGRLFAQARRLAEAEPIARHFPSEESARFAKETAGQYVGLRGRFERAVHEPETIGEAVSAFIDQFAVVDASGQPVMENGQPKLAPDFDLLMGELRRMDVESTVAQLEERLRGDTYANPEMKERDELKLAALQMLREDGSAGSEPGDPDYSGLDPAVRAQMEARDRELKELRDKVQGKDATQSKERQQAERVKFEQDFGRGHAGALFEMVQTEVTSLRERGAHIPEWMLSVTPPGSKVPIFYSNVLDGIRAAVDADPHLKSEAAKLQRLAPSPENLKTRLEFFDGVAKAKVRDLVLAEMKKGVALSRPKAPAAGKAAVPPNPSREPRGGAAAPQARPMTQEQAMETARAQLKSEMRDWDALTPAERNGYALTRQQRLLRG